MKKCLNFLFLVSFLAQQPLLANGWWHQPTVQEMHAQNDAWMDNWAEEKPLTRKEKLFRAAKIVVSVGCALVAAYVVGPKIIDRLPSEREAARHRAVLGVDKYATQHDIRKAYRRLALRQHPDKNNNSKTSVFQEINAANEYLNTYEDIWWRKLLGALRVKNSQASEEQPSAGIALITC